MIWLVTAISSRPHHTFIHWEIIIVAKFLATLFKNSKKIWIIAELEWKIIFDENIIQDYGFPNAEMKLTYGYGINMIAQKIMVSG